MVTNVIVVPQRPEQGANKDEVIMPSPRQSSLGGSIKRRSKPLRRVLKALLRKDKSTTKKNEVGADVANLSSVSQGSLAGTTELSSNETLGCDASVTLVSMLSEVESESDSSERTRKLRSGDIVLFEIQEDEGVEAAAMRDSVSDLWYARTFDGVEVSSGKPFSFSDLATMKAKSTQGFYSAKSNDSVGGSSVRRSSGEGTTVNTSVSPLVAVCHHDEVVSSVGRQRTLPARTSDISLFEIQEDEGVEAAATRNVVSDLWYARTLYGVEVSSGKPFSFSDLDTMKAKSAQGFYSAKSDDSVGGSAVRHSSDEGTMVSTSVSPLVAVCDQDEVVSSEGRQIALPVSERCKESQTSIHEPSEHDTAKQEQEDRYASIDEDTMVVSTSAAEEKENESENQLEPRLQLPVAYITQKDGVEVPQIDSLRVVVIGGDNGEENVFFAAGEAENSLVLSRLEKFERSDKHGKDEVVEGHERDTEEVRRILQDLEQTEIPMKPVPDVVDFDDLRALVYSSGNESLSGGEDSSCSAATSVSTVSSVTSASATSVSVGQELGEFANDMMELAPAALKKWLC